MPTSFPPRDLGPVPATMPLYKTRHAPSVRKGGALLWWHHLFCENVGHFGVPFPGCSTQTGFGISPPPSYEMPPAPKHVITHCFPFLSMGPYVCDSPGYSSAMLWTGPRVVGHLSLPRLSCATAEGGMPSFDHHPESVALGPSYMGTMLGCMKLCRARVPEFQSFWVIFWFKGADPVLRTWSARLVPQWLWNASRGHL